MSKNVWVLLAASLLVGCSAMELETLPGSMDRLGNSRYGYALLVPDKWHQEVNSNIRPTRLLIKAPKTEAGIVLTVIEGGEAPNMEEFIQSLAQDSSTESYTHIRSWQTYFNDMVGYMSNFHWKGQISVLGKKYGSVGKEYQASMAVVLRDPSPILLFCYGPKKEFGALNTEFFADALASLVVQHVEITVREVYEK